MKLSTRSFEIGTFIKEQIDEIITTFPIIAEKGVEGNFAVYRKTGYLPRNTKDIYNVEEKISIEVYIVTNTYKESVLLAQRIKDKLEGFKGKWKESLITDISLDNADEDYSNDAYIQRLYFIITMNINEGNK